MQIMLVIRYDTYFHLRDHIDTVCRMGLVPHLVTHLPAEAPHDPRFAAITHIPAGLSPEAEAEIAIAAARRHGVKGAFTVRETDIPLVARINAALGVPQAPEDTIRIARDKAAQRDVSARLGLPIPRFQALRSAADVDRVPDTVGLPAIVKPTFTNGGKEVMLCHTPDELHRQFARIARAAKGAVATPAVAEEYLPGTEISVDGIVLDGTYVLGGVHNKARMDGPWFMEDLYTLPFRTPEHEPELAETIQKLVAGLKIRRAMINLEFRQDRDGRFKVVEFQMRVGGGHSYRNIRDVYSIDMLRLHIESLLAPDRAFADFDTRRSAPRIATCVKFVYRAGRVVRNLAGKAAQSYNFSQYNMRALPGDLVRQPPEGFDSMGGLSIWTRYDGPRSIDEAERIAQALEAEMDVAVDARAKAPEPAE